jgi:CubicO group peptidase (beta-lactamase class C family)
MKKILLILLLNIGFTVFAQQQKSFSKKEILASMDANANLLLENCKGFSVSIGIVKEGKFYTKHYGEIDKGKSNQANDKTLYEIASTTKVFTGTLMAKAVLDGKIKLDDDIRKYLKEKFPNLEFNGNPIKIKDLVTHETGIMTPFPDTK